MSIFEFILGYLLVIFHVIAAKLQAMFGVYSDKDENDERHQHTAQKTLCDPPIIRLVFNLHVAILTQVDVVISLGLNGLWIAWRSFSVFLDSIGSLTRML